MTPEIDKLRTKATLAHARGTQEIRLSTKDVISILNEIENLKAFYSQEKENITNTGIRANGGQF